MPWGPMATVKGEVKGGGGEQFQWTPGEVIFGFRVLRNYLTLHSITLLINDQYDGHSIKLV